MKKKNITPAYNPEKEIGYGKNAVYVYYFDIYQKFAELNSENKWPCKVGRTDRGTIERIMSQTGTSYPELPRIALIINCEDSKKLEAAIHSILKYKGRWIEDAPGTEWFMTSPNEIQEIYNSLLE